jgi:uncharacterized integral membrane protein
MFKHDRQTRFHPRLALGVLVVALTLVFIVENPRETKIRFIVPQVTAPLWIALCVAAALGALGGGLLARHMAAPELRRLHRAAREASK